jgi:hypothetical protein
VSKTGFETTVTEIRAREQLPRMDLFLSPFLSPGSVRSVSTQRDLLQLH